MKQIKGVKKFIYNKYNETWRTLLCITNKVGKKYKSDKRGKMHQTG